MTRATRPADPSAPPSIREWVKWGAGPRAGQALLLGAKASALMDGRSVPSPDDLRAVALPVLRHRLLVNFQAEADGVDPDQVIGRLLEAISPSVALSPSVVAAIDDLELAARLVVEGLRTGQHRSPLHGYNAEFSQHRPYRAGDDLKYLDWKLLARTDRLYSRQFRETTNMAVMIALDASASMAFPEKGVSKWRYSVDRGRGARAPHQLAGRCGRIDDDEWTVGCATCRRAAAASTCDCSWQSSAGCGRLTPGSLRKSSRAPPNCSRGGA